ncbi:MAG: DUF86 domain-containing protein [Phycisphaerae bacterium]
MPKDDTVYVGHMLDNARKTRSLLGDRGRAAYDADETLRLALAHLLQVVGGAARRISDAFRDQHSDIPWKGIIGMRHKVVHDYMDVDVDIVWDTVTHELPPLIARLEAILPTTGSGQS